MNSSRGAYRRVALFIFSTLVIDFGAPLAQAGPMYVYLVIDPATTAGFGVPAAGGFGVSSNRSGPGTWRLYAYDDVTGSFGIRNYSVTLAGASSITHRSPRTEWDDAPVFGEGSGPFSAGFSDLRSASNISPIVAGQGVGNTQIGGFGRSNSNFQAKIPAAQSYSGTTSGQWGRYCDNCNALYIAEGQYTSGTPSVTAASFSYWTNSQLTASAFAPSYALNTTFFGQPPCIPEPATLTLAGLAACGCLSLVRRRRG